MVFPIPYSLMGSPWVILGHPEVILGHHGVVNECNEFRVGGGGPLTTGLYCKPGLLALGIWP